MMKCPNITEEPKTVSAFRFSGLIKIDNVPLLVCGYNFCGLSLFRSHTRFPNATTSSEISIVDRQL